MKTPNLIHRLIAREERKFGVPLDYLRDLANASLPAFFKLLLFGPLGNHRRHLPREAFHLARLAATQGEDCGTCAQIAIYFARRDGVEPALLRAALSGDDAALPPLLADVRRFARIVAAGDDAPEFRESLRAALGATAFVELSLAIATARFFPAFKRALGHAQSCQLVRIEV